MESSEKRSFKVTNSRQFQVLVSLMQENEQLAKSLPPNGMVRGSLEKSWNAVARKVNLYGPPVRTGYEWKKTWADLKSRTKKKVFENNKIINTCGEGSNRLIYLTELEQTVDRILGFSSSAMPQVVKESPMEYSYTLEENLNDLLTPSEIKTEEDDTATKIQRVKHSKQTEIKKTKPVTQIRFLGKRKFEKTEKQFKLLKQQIKTQEKVLEAIQMQATATETLAEAAEKQAEAMEIIAVSSQSVILALQDAVKFLKMDKTT